MKKQIQLTKLHVAIIAAVVVVAGVLFWGFQPSGYLKGEARSNDLYQADAKTLFDIQQDLNKQISSNCVTEVKDNDGTAFASVTPANNFGLAMARLTNQYDMNVTYRTSFGLLEECSLTSARMEGIVEKALKDYKFKNMKLVLQSDDKLPETEEATEEALGNGYYLQGERKLEAGKATFFLIRLDEEDVQQISLEIRVEHKNVPLEQIPVGF